MNLDSPPNTVTARSAYDTAADWTCHRSISVSPEAADRPVTEPDRPDSARPEVSSRPSPGRSALPVRTSPLTVPDRCVGTFRPLILPGGPRAVVVRSGEVVRHDSTR